MLLVIMGSSCVGKTTIMHELSTKHGWLIMNNYTTRPKRVDDYKIVVSKEYFELEKENMMLVNKGWDSYYGYMKIDYFGAINSSLNYVTDCSINKIHELDNLPNLIKIILLPTNREQLINQIKLSGRLEREEEILKEYDDYFSKLKEGFDRNLNVNCIIHSDKTSTIKKISKIIINKL